MNTDKLLEVKVSRRQDEADGIIAVDLVSCDGDSLPRFEAGAHIDVYVGAGFVRQYSLSNDPADATHYRLAVLREENGRGGSAALHRDFVEGQIVQISAPRNNFKLHEGALHSVLIAGGIGITPLLAMAYRLNALKQSFEFHYLTRTRSRAAFLKDLASSDFSSKVKIYHDDGPIEQKFDIARDFPTPHHDTHLYVCGPQGFMSATIAGAKSAGWVDENIHLEYFTANANKDGDSFVVEARRSKKTCTVLPNQTIVAALSEIGVLVRMSCEEGVCGTCILDVIAGTPDHRDIYQSEKQKSENRQITPCCSRSHSSLLVLDV
jgi:ferredoxin-NADP reductase